MEIVGIVLAYYVIKWTVAHSQSVSLKGERTETNVQEIIASESIVAGINWYCDRD